MEINYWWLNLFFLLMVALVIWLVKETRNTRRHLKTKLLKGI